VAAARRRHPADIATPFLLAFAWLAVEAGDVVRAAELAEVMEVYDSSTTIALIFLLATLHDWPADSWAQERDAAIAHYLGPDHEAAVEQGFAVLGEEIDRVERRLAHR
jgi:hypothetical protein